MDTKTNKVKDNTILRQVQAVFMMVTLLMTTMPVQLALAAEPSAKHRQIAARKIMHGLTTDTDKALRAAKAEKLAKLTKPVVRKLSFSAEPSDLELFDARVFHEPLVPMDDKMAPSENQALAKALLFFESKHDPEDVSDLSKFLTEYPQSRWFASLANSIAQVRFETGYLTDTLKYRTQAWMRAKDQTKSNRKAVADNAISNLVLMEARLGRTKELDQHLKEINHRVMTGSDEQRVHDSRSGLWTQQNHPEVAYLCGPYAVRTLANSHVPAKDRKCSETIKNAKSTAQGTNLAQVLAWANKDGLNMQAAKRSRGAAIVTPAIMHWSVGHFAAITSADSGRYQIEDATFGSSRNSRITAKALDAESDGYFLVPNGPLPTGWRKVETKEAETIWGKGIADDGTRDGGKPSFIPIQTCFTGCSCSGMANASAFSMNATLNIQDAPVGYNPAIGPSMMMGLNFNYNEGNQPTSFTFTNLGANWSLNYISYLTIDGSSNITVRLRGGGYEVFDFVNSAYSPDLITQAQIVNLGGGSYQRQLPDGSEENFTLSDGTNIYMTSVTDPQGNAATISYDAKFRAIAITDAAGNPPTVIGYVSNTFGNSGFYKVASITDGLGRSATFAYDSTNTYLTSITDSVGNVSQFLYDQSSSFINVMTTPYGSTYFYQYTPQGSAEFPPVGLKAVFSDGSSAVIENWLDFAGETYYWDREATAMYPDDPTNQVYTHCKTTKWLTEPSTSIEEPVVSWTKPALEAPVINFYQNESVGAEYVGNVNEPIKVSRNLSGFTQTITIGGTATTGDVLSLGITDNNLPAGGEDFGYTVKNTDTIPTVAAGIAAVINADA